MHGLPPAGWHWFSLDALPAEPWRNGGGTTRTVAVDPAGSPLEWRWRISAADIVQDGPFSSFEGVDRMAVLISGAGLGLQGETGSLHFEHVGDCHRFAGDRPWHARLQGGPCRLWNVMTRRGSAGSATRPLGPTERLEALAGSGSTRPDQAADLEAVAVFVLQGRYRVTAASSPGFDLAAGEGIVGLAGAPPIQLAASGTGANGLLSAVLRPSAAHGGGSAPAG